MSGFLEAPGDHDNNVSPGGGGGIKGSLHSKGTVSAQLL